MRKRSEKQTKQTKEEKKKKKRKKQTEEDFETTKFQISGIDHGCSNVLATVDLFLDDVLVLEGTGLILLELQLVGQLDLLGGGLFWQRNERRVSKVVQHIKETLQELSP